MTDDALRAIRERWRDMVAPWEWHIDDEGSLELFDPYENLITAVGAGILFVRQREQAAIAAAPTDIAALLEELDRLRAEQSRDFDDIVQRVTDRMVAFALSRAFTMPEPIAMPEALRASYPPYPDPINPDLAQ